MFKIRVNNSYDLFWCKEAEEANCPIEFSSVIEARNFMKDFNKIHNDVCCEIIRMDNSKINLLFEILKEKIMKLFNR